MAKDSMHIADDAVDRLRSLGLDTVETVLRYRGGRFAAISSTSETIEVFDDQADEHQPSIYLKRYRYPKRSHRIKAAFRGSLFGKTRARFEFDRLKTMQDKGIPVVKPLAVGQRRICGFVHASFLITEGAQGQSLLSAVKSKKEWVPRDRRTAIDILAKIVKKMHAAGVVHGSLVWRDIIIHQNGPGEFAFAFLDPGYVKRFYIPGCRRFGYLRDVSDLSATAQLLCSKTDRIRFARTYLNVKKFTARDRVWLKRIEARVNRMVDQERHRMEVNDMFIQPTDEES